jgi:hypothetical protein
MTLVIIPPLLNSAGEAIPGKARITLVDAQGRIRVGWSTADGTAVTESLSVTLGAAPVQVPLRPQSAIALDVAGSPTWYEITLTQAGTDRRDTHRFQVPDSASPERLADLIGAATIPAGSLLAGRLVPEASALPDGLTLTTQGGVAVWGTPSGGGGLYKDHEQTIPALVWSILHNFGRYPAAVSVYDQTGSFVLADISHFSINEIRITFATPAIGRAYLE